VAASTEPRYPRLLAHRTASTSSLTMFLPPGECSCPPLSSGRFEVSRQPTLLKFSDHSGVASWQRYAIMYVVNDWLAQGGVIAEKVVACRRESNSCFTSRMFSCCRSCCPSASPESQVTQNTLRTHTPHPSAMSHRGDLDTSTSAPQISAPSPSRSRAWRPLRSGGRPVLTPERDAARATPRPGSPTASCG
jgi:hypothetical protein